MLFYPDKKNVYANGIFCLIPVANWSMQQLVFCYRWRRESSRLVRSEGEGKKHLPHHFNWWNACKWNVDVCSMILYSAVLALSEKEIVLFQCVCDITQYTRVHGFLPEEGKGCKRINRVTTDGNLKFSFSKGQFKRRLRTMLKRRICLATFWTLLPSVAGSICCCIR